MPYSAGTAFLQVVPSFRNVEKAMRKQAAEIGREVDRSVSNALPRGMAEGARRAGREGRRAGDDYSGALSNAIRKHLKRSYEQLPNMEITADSSDADKAIARIRGELEEIHDQHVNLQIDDATALRALRRVDSELEQINRSAATVSVHANTAAARRELRQIEDLANGFDGRRTERHIDDQFSRELIRAARAAERDLPEISLRFDQDGLGQEIAEIRAILKSIGDDEAIGIDVDDDELVRKLREAHTRLQVLHDLGEQDIRLEADTGAALAKIEAFFRTVQARRLAAEREAQAEADRARRGQLRSEEQQRRADERVAAEAARRAERIRLQRERDFQRERARAEREAAQRAEREMGGFARRFRDEMRGAANSIRRVTVDADTSTSQRKLQELRDQIATLGDAHIGVDLDAADARAQIRTLRVQLEQLARETPDIQVRADIAGAYAKLMLMERLADHLDGRRLDLRVDLDDAARGLNNIGEATSLPISRLGALIALIAGVGPALVPIAAGATVMLGSIATAAAGAVAGIGAVALALFGIGDAVKALGEYQKDTLKSAKSLSQSQNQIANAIDSVAGSERALQAARESAAISAKRSAQAVAAARRSVTDAEKDAARAQQELAAAIKDVQQQEEDRQLQLRDNALAQRKANLDLKESKRELDKILANPRATEAERELARISYEERVLQIDQLSSAQKRLVAEQDEANRKGVMGAAQVVAAQERIADSQQAVADANQNLANAVADQRQQQRASARAILSAQEALEQSQRTLRQAYVASGVAGGEALQTLQEKMDALSPAGQRFARFIFSLKDEFLQLRNAAAEGFLPGAETAITALLPYLPRLRDFLGEVSTAMGNIAIRVATAFGNSGWQTFFKFIGQTAVPSLNGMATVTGNLIQGTRDLLIALSAFNKPIGRGLIDMTEAYARWAFQLKSSEGYRKFLDYVKSVGPDVVDFFLNLGEAIWDILVAAAPVGKIILGLVDGLLRLVSAIPTPVLTGLILVISALGIGFLVVAGIMKTVEFRARALELAHNGVTRAAAFAATATDRLTLAQVRNSLSMGTLMTGLRNFGAGFTSLSGAITSTGRAATGFAAFMSGPWGLALIGASIVVGLFFSKMQGSEEKMKANIDAFRRLGEEIDRTGSIQSDAVRKMIKDNAALKNFVLELDRFAKAAGDTNTKLAELASGNPEAQFRLQADAAAAYATDLDTLAKALTGNEAAQKQLIDTLKIAELNGSEKGLAQVAKRRREELEGLFAQQKLNAAVERELAAATSGTNDTFEDANPGIKDYVDALKTLADASSSAADKTDALRRADEALFGTQRNLQESIEAQARALRERNELLDDENFLRQEGARSLNINTVAGAKLTDVIEAELEAINATFRANIANGDTVEEATRKHNKEIEALRKKTQDKRLDQTATEHLIAVYGQVPTSRVTEFATKEFGTTRAQLDELMVYQLALREGISLETARARLHPDVRAPGGRGNSQNAGLATGGPVIGPGDKTSDSVQAWIPKTRTPIALSDGEWVHRASAVDYYGTGLMRAINEKRIPREMLGMIGYARGGLLRQVVSERYPFPYNTKTTKIPSKDEVGRAVQRNRGYDSGPGGAGPGFLPWPSSPKAQRGDTGVWRSIMKLVRESGIPYNFGNAYRDGDPLWHGSGRAVDFMGYNQDELAQFFLKRQSQLLELIHLTPKGGYFVTRGQRKQNFPIQGPLHRNHLHVAMAKGGLVGTPPQLTSASYDSGGPLAPGYTLAYNGTGRAEQVLTSRQMADVQIMAKQAAAAGNAYHFQFKDTTLDASKLRSIQNREAALARVGRAR